jgi:hypothetical protein
MSKKSIIIYHREELFKEDDMGRACSTHRGGEECIYNFGVKSRRI